ncbi:MAG: Esterase/lipase [Candidatus Eremiobacteraeota bacterium]|nr:Esterase/lipase [Candidatus Eremiobacteraeota bacterium]
MAQAIGILPEAVRRRLAGSALLHASGVALDSRTAVLMRAAERSGRAFRPDVTVAQLRKSYARMNRVCGLHEHRAVTARDVRIDTGDGTIGARLYRPGSAGTNAVLPLLVYFHGGGYVIGDVESYDGLARFFAAEGGIAVLSADYRLGPEHRFPRGHEDAFAAFAWVQREAAALGTDPARIAVGGDSAGGGLAAAIGAFAHERGLVPPAYQFLIYPAVDARGDYPSRRSFDHGLPLTSETIAWFAPRYATREHDAAALFSPLLAPHPERTPPTYLLAAGFDPLVDEGRVYADRLRTSGVDVTYDLRPALSHAFVNLAGVVPEARRALRDGIRATAAALRSGTRATATGLRSAAEASTAAPRAR